MDQSIRSSISHQSNGINRQIVSSSVMHQWEAIGSDGKSLVIQNGLNGLSDHSNGTKLVVASSLRRVHDDTTQQAIHMPIIAPNSPIHCQLIQLQQNETFQISSSSSDLLSQNTYLNTIACWSPKIMPPAKDMTQKENLGLLEQDNNGDIKQNYYNG